MSDPTPEPGGSPAAPPEPAVSPPPPESPAAPPESPAAPAPRPARSRAVPVAVALVVVSTALAVLAAVLAARVDADRQERDDVRRVAGRFAEALLTYDFEHLDEAKERVLALSTGNFRQEYEQAFEGGLDTLLRETQARSQATVTDIFVGEVEDGATSAIVVADARAEGSAGTRRTVSSYIRLELVKVEGRWRVDGVTNLNFGQEPAPTTTTTAPG